MSTVLLIARSELRSSARLLVGLAVLVALVSGLVLATWAGARRTETSVDRMASATHARDLEIQVEADTETVMAAYRAIGDLPGVAGVGTMTVAPAMVVTETPTDELREGAALAVMDDLGTVDLDQPRILMGRTPAEGSVDEVLVNQVVLDGLGAEVGDRFTVATMTAQELGCLTGQPCPDGLGISGPLLDLEIVGLGRWMDDLQGSNSAAGPILVASPALMEHWQDEVGFFPPMAGLHLEAGADVDAVASDVVQTARRAVGDDVGVQVTTADELFADSARDSVGVLADAMRLLGAVSLGAGLLIVAQAVGRHFAAAHARTAALESLGAPRIIEAVALALPVSGGLLVGVGLGVLVAIAASPLFPVGLGRLAETEVGVHVDAATFALVGGGLCVALGALTAVLAWTSTSRRTTAVRPAHRGRSQVVAWSSPVSTFARHLAFPRAPRAARVSATSTAFGLALAVAGLLAALTVQTSVGATVASPERWGWNWDSAVELDDAVPVAEIVERADVQAAALGTIAKIELDGRQAGGFALEPVRGDLRFTIVRGRLPVSGDEVALGAETLSELGVDVGDTVTDASGGELAVVGTVVIPPNFDSADTDRGAVLTPAGLDAALVGDGYDALLLRYEPGVDRLSVEAELTEGGARLTVVRPPGALANVQSTTWITQVLAAYFALLGLAGLAHGIVVSTRRSRGDTAVVTTLGFERTEVRRSVVLQATFLTAVGLVAGVPIGLVLGRAAWRWVVDGIGVIELAATPVAAALALVPLAVALAALVAIVPAWSAARRRPALDLRAE